MYSKAIHMYVYVAFYTHFVELFGRVLLTATFLSAQNNTEFETKLRQCLDLKGGGRGMDLGGKR
jgi:hypothetical protein